MPFIYPSCQTMSGGVTASAGTGEDTKLTFGGSWATGDTYQVVFTDSQTGLQTQVGSGNVTGVQPSFCFTFNNKVYALSSTTVYFSAIDGPTTWDDPNGTGNGFIVLSDYFATAQQTLSCASYQGRIAFLARDNIQIWIADPDPAQYQKVQILENIGTNAANSVQSIGDLDVVFLYDTGFRSLRVRDSSLNGFIVDLGSPIDDLVQAVLQASTGTEITNANGVVNPLDGRYWCFLHNTIFVLSYFPGSKVTAWSQYDATYSASGTQTAFVPQTMFTYQGKVYLRSSDAYYIYGGANGTTYDNVVAQWTTSYLPMKSPGTMKTAKSIGFAAEGNWQLSISLDPIGAQLIQVVDTSKMTTNFSYDSGRIAVSGFGSHVQFSGKTTGSTAATFAGLNFQYTLGDER